MRYIILVLFLFVFTRSIGQASSASPYLINAASTMLPSANSPQQITTQAENWRTQKIQSPRNAAAWFNYYLWTERDKRLSYKEKKGLLSAAVTEAQQFISQSAEYYLLLYLESGKKDSASLYKALSLTTDKSLVYPYVIQYCIIQQDYTAVADYAQKLDELKPLSESLHTYHYNVLMSADSNAVIYGKGLYDLIPMAQAQYAHKVRRDIRLRYYEGMPANEANAYLCLSLGKEILSQYPNGSYTGLLVKIKGTPDIKELKKHIEKDMNLWFLRVAGYWEDAEQLYKNYLPSFVLLYRHYKKTDNAEAERMQILIQEIARKAGITEEADQLLEN